MDILESFLSSQPISDSETFAVRAYFAWQSEHRQGEFIPRADDDVELRTYLFFLHSIGADQAILDVRVNALERFYRWAYTQGIISHNPFDEYTFSIPLLVNGQVEPRQQDTPLDDKERELERLRAMGQIVEQLNGSVDIRSALESSLRTLLQVMNLQSGWVSLLAGSQSSIFSSGDAEPHGFVLATACDLPPGLSRDDCHFLRQPPACHCQRLLTEGRLARAINIVECTRMRDSMRAAGDNQGLRFHASVPLISQAKPLGLINVATADWQFLTEADLHFLSAVSAQVVVALERAQLYEVAETRRVALEKELQVAREVQAGLMPHQMPEIPGYCLAGAWHPARQVSGDFYDIFPLNEGRWGIVIGDVSDKGTAAALYMAMVHSQILSGALREQSPAAVLMEINRVILQQLSSLVFATVFMAVVDPITHTFLYANAGQNPPILRRSDGTIETLGRTGSAVGVFKDLQMSDRSITLNPGDALVLYTDGATEAWHPINQDYGTPRLVAAITAAPRQAEELLAYIEADLNNFTKDTELQDDVTFLVMTRE